MKKVVCLVVLQALAVMPLRAGKLEGWIEADYSASTAAVSNLPEGFDLFADHAHLHQAWLSYDDKLMKLDLFAGTDYFFTRAKGLFAHQGGEIGFDPLEFYLKGKVHHTELWLGRFSSPICAEYNAGPSNTLPSHCYSFIYDPFTHTGLYAQTAMGKEWTLLNGVVTGSDVFVDPSMSATLLDGIRFIDSKDNKKSAQLFAITGSGSQVDVVDLVVTYPLDRRTLFTADTMYGWQGGADWSGVVPYLNYTFSDRLNATLRVERFDDPQGNRTGFAGVYWDYTAGVAWKLDRHWTLRPELRTDHCDGASPFEGRSSLTTAKLDAYVRW